MASKRIDWRRQFEEDVEQDARIEELKKVAQEPFCYVVPSVGNSEDSEGTQK